MPPIRMFDPCAGTAASFKLDITRRCYYVDCMTGERVAVLVRNWKLVLA